MVKLTSNKEIEPLDQNSKDALRRIEKMADALDSKFKLPGTKIRFGWDSIVGLVPVVGDTITVLPQVYLIYEARRLKLGNLVIARMFLNIFIDWLVGSIPLLGDLFDLAFKSNRKNAELVKKTVKPRHAD